MLCHRCVLNVVKVIGQINGIRELDVSLEDKRIKIVYDNKKFSKQDIQDIVNKSIINGKVNIDYFNKV